MHPGEYEVMARVEGSHWWYRGLRDAVGRTLDRQRPALQAGPRVLDAGCGTGENLRFLRDRLGPSYLGGFDNNEEAIRFARDKVPDADVYRSDICDPVLHVDEVDLIVSLDVIYIPGVQRSLGGLRRLVGSLRPGGLFVVNLPAYDWLYSEHDVAIHTGERFTASAVRSLFANLGLSVERLTYRLCLLFPAVVFSRLPGILRVRRGKAVARSDLHSSPGPWVNRALSAILGVENRLIARGARLPWGSSVFGVGRKG